MMQSVDVARTHEILARYRPIAPRPPMQLDTAAAAQANSGEKQQQSPAASAAAAAAIRLPSRSPRSRKRGRGSAAASSASHAFASQLKKARVSSYPPLLLPSPTASGAAAAASQIGCHQAARLGLAAVQGLARGFPVFPFLGASGLQLPGGGGLEQRTAASAGGGDGSSGGGDLLTLSLLTPRDGKTMSPEEKNALEQLNAKAAAPVEKDLLGALNQSTHSSVMGSSTIIVPQPIRPVGSSISVGSITEDDDAALVAPADKRPEEVEDEVESDSLPAIVSDSNNRVRLANSAYREMVGQPECPWLHSMMASAVSSACKAAAATKRISGEVMLGFQDQTQVPPSSNGFSCKVKIEWARDGRKTLVTAPCHVVRVACKAKDYVFTWRFHTDEASVTTNCTA